jgi:hypothetical protein
MCGILKFPALFALGETLRFLYLIMSTCVGMMNPAMIFYVKSWGYHTGCPCQPRQPQTLWKVQIYINQQRLHAMRPKTICSRNALHTTANVVCNVLLKERLLYMAALIEKNDCIHRGVCKYIGDGMCLTECGHYAMETQNTTTNNASIKDLCTSCADGNGCEYIHWQCEAIVYKCRWYKAPSHVA